MNLSPLQRIKRRIWLLKGSYTHPDGTIELDIDEKAGIDPTVDDEETVRRKFDNRAGNGSFGVLSQGALLSTGGSDDAYSLPFSPTLLSGRY